MINIYELIKTPMFTETLYYIAKYIDTQVRYSSIIHVVVFGSTYYYLNITCAIGSNRLLD